MDMLWGFGAVTFSDGVDTITLNHATGRLGFTEERNVYRTKSGGTVVNHRGYRAKISVKLWNIGKADKKADAQTLSEVVAMLNSTKNVGIIVAPRVEAAGSLHYLCLLDSDIDPEDISYNVPVGQTLDLEFTGKETLPNLPTFTSSEEYYNVVDADGDQIVDDDGNKIIARF